MRNTYITVNGKSMCVVFSRRAKENGISSFRDNILFVLETCLEYFPEKFSSQYIIIRNRGFDYDIKVTISSEPEEIVVLNFTDIREDVVPDIDFNLSAIFG